MPEVIDEETGEVTKFPYDESGIKAAAKSSAPKEPSDAVVTESMGILNSEEPDLYDKAHSEQVLKNATPEQKAQARKDLDIPEGMNMGGVVVDELGYMHGGMNYTKRGPIKYSKGGAVRGRTFSGSY
jgi:hypothetical protein